MQHEHSAAHMGDHMATAEARYPYGRRNGGSTTSRVFLCDFLFVCVSVDFTTERPIKGPANRDNDNDMVCNNMLANNTAS